MWDHLRAKHKDAFKAAKSSQEEFVAKKKKETDDAIAARRSLYQLNAAPQPSLEHQRLLIYILPLIKTLQ